MNDEGSAADGGGEQLALLAVRGARRRRPAPAGDPAEVDPVALVLVDTGLPHLDRPFEYLVPARLADEAVPGVRVRVRFAGRDRDGFLIERRAQAEHVGALQPLRSVVSPEVVLTTPVLAAAIAVADRAAGSVMDVLRLAVPPRHASTEKAGADRPPSEAPSPQPLTAWEPYAAGRAFLGRLTAGGAPAASALAVPSVDPALSWPALLAQAAAHALAADRGSVIVVPDARDLDRVDAALAVALGSADHHVRLSADQGPAARYAAYLKVARGQTRIVVGTRGAALAPVDRLGLFAWWDDGDDLLEEPRSPCAPVREIARARAEVSGCALLSAGFTRSVSIQSWVESGTMRPLVPIRAVLRQGVPRVRLADEGLGAHDPVAARAHLPPEAWRVAKEALVHGPVLVQVPRRGYEPTLSCQDCRTRVRCRSCAGPLARDAAGAQVRCRWCGTVEAPWTCAECGSPRVRASVVGARRSADELGRAFPGVGVLTSGADTVRAAVDDRPRLVVATPGAEPVAEGGFAAALLLDAWALLDRPTLDAAEEALRRWLGAAALVRGGPSGGVVVLCGAPTHTVIPAVEALLRWDPAWFAERELAERRALDLPPAVRLATISGSRRSVTTAMEDLRTQGLLVRGPLRVGGRPESWRALVTAAGGPQADPEQLGAVLQTLRRIASARKEPDPVTVHVDPRDPTI